MGFFSGVSDFAGNLTGGLIGSSDAEDAAKNAKKLSSATQYANITDFKNWFSTNEQQMAPYLQAGSQAISDLMDAKWGDPEAPELALFAYPNPEAPQLDVFRYATPQTPELEKFVFDSTQLGGTDAYKWRYEQGLQATDRAQAANRGLTSGNRLTALQDYGQGAASQEYENEWTRQLNTNLQENQRRTQGYEMDVNRFNQERQINLDENQRKQDTYGMDVGRFNRAFDVNQMNNQMLGQQYGLEANRFGNQMQRLQNVAGQGQTATTNLASQRLQTVGAISGARGQNAANQFASSLIPVQETQNWVSGMMDLGGSILGRK